MNEEALNYFFKGYFHQDWFAEYGTFESAVLDFCENENESRVLSVKSALIDLLGQGNITDQTIFGYGGYVQPEAFSTNTKNLLIKIIEIMD